VYYCYVNCDLCACFLFTPYFKQAPVKKRKKGSRALVLPEQRAQLDDGLYTLYCIVVLLITYCRIVDIVGILNWYD
jgi:hypothetical protein